jgi:RimJ/RimL family protein N-acetyltransferase
LGTGRFVERKSDGVFLGRLGLYNPEGWPGLEVGWAIDRAYWGNGYAPEGARAAIQFGFETLGVDRLISLIYPENANSIRVAQKLGMRRDGEAMLMNIAMQVYAIARAEFGANARMEQPTHGAP